MAFQLKQAESVSKGIRRLVRKQIDNSLAELSQPEEAPDEVVHDARKRFKKIRSVLRLVRDDLGKKVYRRENTCFRDAGRPLTEVRDAKVLVDTLDKLAKHFGGQVADGAFDGVRKTLHENQEAVRKKVLEEEKALGKVTRAVEGARGRLGRWPLGKGWPALRGGLKRTYKEGCRALDAAVADPTVENLHEWRKQAKYLWHQLEVLEPVWPAVLKELADQVHELTQLLGDDHDLAVLREVVTADPDRYGGDGTLETLLALTDRRREELQQAAFLLGHRIYQDRPQAFTDRLKGYWKEWRSETAAVAQV